VYGGCRVVEQFITKELAPSIIDTTEDHSSHNKDIIVTDNLQIKSTSIKNCHFSIVFKLDTHNPYQQVIHADIEQ
jgi:hypothetical protein